ncbi:hypothetical protein LCGC14_0548900 [marine sediment metagenome]|uniref:Uncharacterized protein n=1 Tax=marine sediment metagenome TaxID=412755 RepID=A0A0F9RQR5_9ZZZZ
MMRYQTVNDSVLENAWLILRECNGESCSRDESVASLVEHMVIDKRFAHDIIHKGRYGFWHIALNENNDERIYIHSKGLHIY